MVDFEKTASDPRRLFRASFQLNEEEKFRRTCFPTLLQLDESLLKAIQDFERASGKPFMLGNRRYRDTLVNKRTLRSSLQFPVLTLYALYYSWMRLRIEQQTRHSLVS